MTRSYGVVLSVVRRVMSVSLVLVLLAALSPGTATAQQLGPPAAPTSLAEASGTLTWSQLTGGGDARGWNIYHDDAYINTVIAPTRSFDLPSTAQSGEFYIVAFDHSDPAQFSPRSATITVGETPTLGNPAAPTNLLSPTPDTLSWDQPDNGVLVRGWNIYFDDNYITTVNAPDRTYELPSDARTGVYYVVAFDFSDPSLFSPRSAPLSVDDGGTPNPDPDPDPTPDPGTPPPGTRPTNFTVTANADGEAVLEWDSTATDFQINRCSPRAGETDQTKCEPLAFPINIGYLANVSDATTYTDGTTAGTTETFVYRVDALDGGGKSDVIAFRNGQYPVGGQPGPHPTGSANPSFSDEFNGTELDDQRWETSHRWGSEDVINSELQHYVDVQDGEDTESGYNPFSFTGSALRITASNTPFSDQQYTSGVITSAGAFTYGYVEARVNLPAGSGLWPAFWLYEEGGGASEDGASDEIDIVEHISAWPNLTTRNFWCTGCGDGDGFGSIGSRLVTPISGPEAIDYSQGWHTFAIDWRPGSLTWYVDGAVVDTYTGDDVSDDEMYIIANLAMGDGFGVGATVTDETAASLDERPFDIDYIRMYDIPGVTQGPREGEGQDAAVRVLDASDPTGFAIDVSRERFDDGTAPYAVLASAETFADALSGTPLLGDGPLLLVEDLEADGGAVDDELDRVMADRGFVYILGGPAAVSWEPEGWPITRLAGPTRIETATAIHMQMSSNASSNRGMALLARAYGVRDNPSSAFADSLTGGGYAAAAGLPVLLTGTEELHPATQEALADVDTTYLLGGEAALSAGVGDALPGSIRVAGPSRDSTAVALVDELWHGDASTNRIVIDGYDENAWQWGLVAAGLAADQSTPILVTSADGVPESTRDAITAADSDVLLIGDFTAAERRALVEQLEGAIAARP